MKPLHNPHHSTAPAVGETFTAVTGAQVGPVVARFNSIGARHLAAVHANRLWLDDRTSSFPTFTFQDGTAVVVKKVTR